MTHWVVDTDAFNSRDSVSMATLTMVVSNMTAIAPMSRGTASFRNPGSTPRSLLTLSLLGLVYSAWITMVPFPRGVGLYLPTG